MKTILSPSFFLFGCVLLTAQPSSEFRAKQRPAPARLTPLADMSASDRYESEDGGLYGAGFNTPPDAHHQRAEAEPAKIQPLDATGAPDENGIVGFVAISLSKTDVENLTMKTLVRG